jgi:TRAP-type transport system periplasmic protein
MNMKKCTAVCLALSMLLGLTLVLAGPGNAAPGSDKIIMKLGNIQNVESPLAKGCLRFSDLVREKTNGQVEVRVYPSSQLGSGPDQLKGVSIGSQELFVDGWSFAAALSKDWAILSTGFLLKDMDQVRKMLASDVGKALFEDLRVKSNVRVIGDNWDRGRRNLYTKRPVKSLADLAGMKIRVPNKVYFETWKQLGATPSIVDFGEVYGALQQGVIDGLEVPITEAYTSKVFEVVKNVTMINYIPQIAPLWMNDKKFQSLPPNFQKALLESAEEAGVYTSKLQVDSDKKVIEELKKSGVNFYYPDLTEWIAKAKPLAINREAAGAWSKGLYDRLQAAIK